MAVRGWSAGRQFVSSRTLILAAATVVLGIVYIVLPTAQVTNQNSVAYKARLEAAKSMFDVMMDRGGTSKERLTRRTAEIVAGLPNSDPTITPDQVARINALYSSLTNRHYEDLQAATLQHYARYYSLKDIETYSNWLAGGNLGRPDRRLRIALTSILRGHELASTLSDLKDARDHEYEAIGEAANEIAAESH